jgi:tRNA(fMet)-specific endonuclease VapC
MNLAGPIVLDASAVIDYFRREPILTSLFSVPDSLFLPTIVAGELYCGARRSNRPAVHLAQIDELLNRVTLLAAGLDTAAHYGKIKAELEGRGERIGSNDIWIAAIALEHGLPLLTRDNHFDRIPTLPVLRW